MFKPGFIFRTVISSSTFSERSAEGEGAVLPVDTCSSSFCFNQAFSASRTLSLFSTSTSYCDIDAPDADLAAVPLVAIFMNDNLPNLYLDKKRGGISTTSQRDHARQVIFMLSNN